MLKSPNSGLNKMTRTQLEGEVVRLNKELKKVTEGITRYLSQEQKTAIREIISDKIDDIIWDKHFYTSAFTPFTVITGASTTEVIERLRDTSGNLFLSVDMPTKFRVSFNFGSSPTFGNDCTCYITTVHVRSVSGTTPIKANGAEFVGIKIVDNRIYLCSYLDETETEKLIDTQKDIVDDETVILEVQYFPRERADFYINNEYVGSITGVLPKNNTPIIFFPIFCSLKPSVASVHTLNIDYYEFLQQRKNT